MFDRDHEGARGSTRSHLTPRKSGESQTLSINPLVDDAGSAVRGPLSGFRSRDEEMPRTSDRIRPTPRQHFRVQHGEQSEPIPCGRARWGLGAARIRNGRGRRWFIPRPYGQHAEVRHE